MAATFTQEIRNTFQQGSILTRLIIINVMVWVAINLLILVFFLFGIQTETIDQFIRWFAVPASIKILVIRPWTLITYMFLHEAFFHILFNMLWFYWFGKIFLEYLGAKKLLSTYVLGGLAGAVLYIIAFNVFPVFDKALPYSYALGASASVLAVVIAISTFVPNYTLHLMFLGPVKLKYIAIFSVVMDLLSIQGGNPGGHIAHIGGALFGYIYIRQFQKGKDLSIGFNRFVDRIASYFYTSDSKLHVSHSSKKSRSGFMSRSQRKSDEDYNLQRKAKQQKIDDILDKISKSGYESLTREEKNILFKISNNN